jgi:ATP phosphoribosyltransferase
MCKSHVWGAPAHLQIPDVEVWFQRASDVVRKLRLGDIDLGIVGYDMFQEIGDGDR